MQQAKNSTTLRPHLRPCDRKKISAAMNGKSLLVQCHRPDLHTRYAYFDLRPDALHIRYLNIQKGLMVQTYSETLSFAEYPEARLLHDGSAWNVGELSCWLRYAETPEERES